MYTELLDSWKMLLIPGQRTLMYCLDSQLLACHSGGLGLIPGQSKYDLWWQSGNRTGVSEFFGFSISIIPSLPVCIYSSITNAI